MTGTEVGVASLLLMLVLIWAGIHVAVVLAAISFAGVWLIKGNVGIASSLLAQAASDAIASHIFGVVPLFVLMGFLVSIADIGKDAFEVANRIFRKLRGGLGIATVAANAAFAAVTGSSIASASVFTRVSVPEMIRYDYSRRFAVGVVAGSSVLGMIIPPSVMMIIYAFVAEQSVGDMFLAGVVPGLILSLVFMLFILAAGLVAPGYIGHGALAVRDSGAKMMSGSEMTMKLAPLVLLILIVLGGIYSGLSTASEAGAAGAFTAFIIATLKRRLTWIYVRQILVDTGHITASILFLIMAATMYNRMLGIAGLPSMLSAWLDDMQFGFVVLMAFYVVLLLFLGTIIDTASIILICVPLFLKAIEEMGMNLVWFGVITVIGAEVGLLTPPFGISCFVIKATLDRSDITLNDIFIGALPFAILMLAVLIALIAFPQLSTTLL